MFVLERFKNKRLYSLMSKQQLEVGRFQGFLTITSLGAHVWLGGAVVRAFGLATERSWVQIPAATLSSATLDKLFTHIFQRLWCYNLMAIYKSVYTKKTIKKQKKFRACEWQKFLSAAD